MAGKKESGSNANIPIVLIGGPKDGTENHYIENDVDIIDFPYRDNIWYRYKRTAKGHYVYQGPIKK